jgi:hypothetical protein
MPSHWQKMTRVKTLIFILNFVLQLPTSSANQIIAHTMNDNYLEGMGENLADSKTLSAGQDLYRKVLTEQSRAEAALVVSQRRSANPRQPNLNQESLQAAISGMKELAVQLKSYIETKNIEEIKKLISQYNSVGLSMPAH